MKNDKSIKVMWKNQHYQEIGKEKRTGFDLALKKDVVSLISFFKVVTFLVQEIFQHVRPPVFCLHQRYYGLLNKKNHLQVVIFF